MNAHVSNIWRLGIKELRSLWADRVLLLLIVWAFTGGIYSAAKGITRAESCASCDYRPRSLAAIGSFK